ncbi:MAG: AmmeMemoRadiSam system radical SAM enzyme [Candidatus Riflebacteria bacterium]|nr:AmmeMemoRadiSam system radical SAM enzyme [Candidatus Riflebacteria bacterium]
MSNVYSESVPKHNLHLLWNDTRKEAYFYDKLSDGKTKCRLCPRNCMIAQGQSGFCKVRKNIDGTLYTQNYGKATHITVERIEAEAMFHYKPGAKILSLGNFGCNLNCDYCQNWTFSQFQYTPPQTIQEYTTEDVIRKAKADGIEVLSWTYNDPAVWMEFVIDTAREARKHGLKNLFKSAFFLSPEVVSELIKVIDVFAISIKAMDEDYYKKFTKAWLKPVLDNTRQVHESGVHYELSNLVVTGLTNNDDNYDKMIDFILKDLTPKTPIHFTRFHPDYKYMDHEKTPLEDVFAARNRAMKKGLTYAYVGNAFESEGLNTYCPSCKELLVERFGLSTFVKESLKQDGTCNKCGYKTTIVF